MRTRTAFRWKRRSLRRSAATTCIRTCSANRKPCRSGHKIGSKRLGENASGSAHNPHQAAYFPRSLSRIAGRTARKQRGAQTDRQSSSPAARRPQFATGRAIYSGRIRRADRNGHFWSVGAGLQSDGQHESHAVRTRRGFRGVAEDWRQAIAARLVGFARFSGSSQHWLHGTGHALKRVL